MKRILTEKRTLCSCGERERERERERKKERKKERERERERERVRERDHFLSLGVTVLCSLFMIFALAFVCLV